MNTLFWEQRAEGDAWQPSLRRPKVWGTSWCERRKGEAQATSPTTNDHLLQGCGYSRALSAAPDRPRQGEVTKTDNPPPQSAPTGVYSQQTLFGVQTHQVPAERTSLDICQVGWGRARSVKPKDQPFQGRPRPGQTSPGAVTELPQSHILGSGPRAFLPGRPIFTTFDT